MKPFAKRLLALASAAAITLTTIPTVHADNTRMSRIMSESQQASSENSDSQDLISTMVRSALASAPLTRQGLSTLIMDSYKSVTGLTDEDLGQPDRIFIDSEDQDVLNAYHLGLMDSQGAAFFGPYGTVTRQDFWTIAANLLDTVGYPYIDDIQMDLSIYTDADQVSDYAKVPLQALLYLEIITAAEDTALCPDGTVTYEEAVLILERLTSFYGQWLEDPVVPQCYLGEEIAAYALNYIGCRYVSGGRGPNKFDCSGFVYYVYKHFGYNLKPGAQTQWANLDETINQSDLIPGDLVFFSRGGRSSRIFHVGIYIGDGQFVHAANSRKGVIVTDLDDPWYAGRYHGAKRAIG